MGSYDFGASDFEDGGSDSQYRRDRVSLFKHLLIYWFLISAVMLVFIKIFSSLLDFAVFLAALAFLQVFPRLVGGGVRDVAESLRIFVWDRIWSIGCAVSAVVLSIVGVRDRIQSLRHYVLFFTCAVFVVSIFGSYFAGAYFHHILDGVKGWGVVACAVFAILWVGLCSLAAVFLSAVAVLIFAIVGRFFSKPVGDCKDNSPCLHISDLHWSSGNTVEVHPLAIEDLQIKFKEFLKGSAEKQVVITGDITDGGGRCEWLDFIECCAGFEDRNILLVPGNHDLFPYVESFRPLRSALAIGSRLVAIRKVRYLFAASRLCKGLKAGNGKPLADVLNENCCLVKILSGQDVAVCSDGCNGFGGQEKYRLLAEVDKLWGDCFPLIFSNGDFHYVILDTNRKGSSFVTAAFGSVDSLQYKKLASILRELNSPAHGAGKKIVVLGHHHLHVPYLRGMGRLEYVKVKFLEMVGLNDLLSLVSSCSDYYLHGHRHVEYSFKVGRVSVFSAGSFRAPN